MVFIASYTHECAELLRIPQSPCSQPRRDHRTRRRRAGTLPAVLDVVTIWQGFTSRNDVDEAGVGVDDRGGISDASEGQAVVLLLDLAVSGDDDAKGAVGLGGRGEDLHDCVCSERPAGQGL